MAVPGNRTSGAGAGSSRYGWRGRDREWGTVARLLQAARDGRSGVLLIEGHPGIGKTRLLEEAVESAAAMGFMIARGAAEEWGRLLPLAPLMSALGETRQTLLSSGGPADGVDLRLRLVEGLQARLEERAGHGPLLVTLDDLHWADPTSLLALRSLIPELASYPLVWLVSRTTGQGDDQAEKLYEILERDGAARIVLAALEEPAVAEIMTDVFGAAPSAELLTLAAGVSGNPFLLTELLNGLRDEHAIAIVEGQVRPVSAQVPQRIQEIVHRRLRRLSPGARHLLQVAAILGRTFAASDLAEMLGESPARLLPLLEEAESAGIVVSGPDLLGFRHALQWLGVTETIAPSMRQALHCQAGHMLLDRGESAVVAAGHLVESAGAGDAAALAGLDRAVRELLPASPETAANLAVRALELTTPGDDARPDRTLTAVRAQTAAGRLNEAVQLARAALSRVTSPDQVAWLRYELAYALLLSGGVVEAVAEAEQALSNGDLPDELHGLIDQVLFQAPLGSRANQRVRRHAETILADPQTHSRPSLIAAHMILVDIAWSEGRAADGLDHSCKAARLADDEPIRNINPQVLRACTLMAMRRLSQATAALEIPAEQATALGATAAHAAIPTLLRARLWLIEGRLDDAATEARTGLDMAEALGVHLYDPYGTTVLAIVALHQGDLETAAAYADRCQSHVVPDIDALSAWWWGNWVPALVAEAQGGHAKAIDLLHAPFTDAAERCFLLMVEPDAAAWLTRTALAVGDRAGAEAVTATAERLGRDNPGFPTLAASAAHAHGLLRKDATALAHAAADHVSPWSRASAAEDLGVLHTGAADQKAAIHHLDQALETYQRAGALRDAARVRARLRGLGVRRHYWSQAERPATGWGSLTDTEHNVATLAAQGLTNPQIAAHMFISRETVKFHLRQIFRKLGIASRVELARLIAEHRLNAPAPPT